MMTDLVKIVTENPRRVWKLEVGGCKNQREFDLVFNSAKQIVDQIDKNYDEMDALQLAENTQRIDILMTIISNMQDDILKLHNRIKELEDAQPYDGYSDEGDY